MGVLQKVRLLGQAAKFDNCASSASSRKIVAKDRIGDAAACGICHSFGPDGRCISLYKTLLTNVCTHDCKYCTNNPENKKEAQRATFSPDELAKTFMSLYVKNYVEGLFLSSGVMKDPDHTTQNMIEAINLIRNKYKFKGYIHFKVLPGTSYELIKQASEFSDRMSVNLEAPNKSRLSEISSVKDFKIDILRRQRWVRGLISKRTQSNQILAAGQTTQVVVGGTDATDFEILRMMDWEYKNMELKRGYYSAFIPVKGTPFESKARASLHREHRLFNIDFMLRKYGMKLKEFMPVMSEGMLPRYDPKVALAHMTITEPVNVNKASYEELIRVPGIGPQSATRITMYRKRKKQILNYEELHNLGVVLKRAKPFIKVGGKTQASLKKWF
ncbi:putative DNA modification/repair radical SAM protein [Candidatus Woesearchaeota archaeon]|nr:putative DNA modification/repair radical SAM protein [Candidatus Woesearchaeota archaeon]